MKKRQKTKNIKNEGKDAAKDLLKSTDKNIEKPSESVETSIEEVAIGIANFEKNFFVEYNGKQINESAIFESFYAEWSTQHNINEIKTLNIYFKSEDETAYCVVNGDTTIEIYIN